MPDRTYVPDELRKLAELYEGRNKLYSDNYMRFGKVMLAHFPDGLTIRTADDWNRLGVLVQVIAKFTRYVARFESGGHADSLDDTSVYAQMLKEIDEQIEQDKVANETPTAGHGNFRPSPEHRS
jgi:hypothetical protein